MSDIEDQDTENKKSGSGKAKGGSGSGGIRLPPNKFKDVANAREYLDAAKVIARLAEFFSEGVAKASAHVQVGWANLKDQGFAIVLQLIQKGQEIAQRVAELRSNPTRENLERLRMEFGLTVG